MSLVILSAAETDLLNKAPFGQGFSVIGINMTAGALTVQHSDVSGSGFATVTNGVLGAATSTTAMGRLTDLKRYIKLSGAGTVFLLPDKDL